MRFGVLVAAVLAVWYPSGGEAFHLSPTHVGLKATPTSTFMSPSRASTSHATQSIGRGGATRVMVMASDASHPDVIVVGGGIGGCILANKLTESGKKNVLLLEAGKPSARNLLVNIPAGVIRLFKSALDWQYISEPEKTLDGKKVYLVRGKTLGGSSALNVMLVHRGTPRDYEKWVQAGATGWGPSDMADYFRKSESNSVDEEGKYHGKDGLYHVENVRYQNPLSVKFLEACGQIGMNPNPDFNDWSRDQVGYGRYRVSQRKGSRWTAAKTYLKQALGRSNLKVESQALATRVVIEGGRAVGVEYVDAKGEKHVVRCSEGGEVILSGGAVNSPQLLQLSGIGRSDELRSVGITPIVDRPGVGENLQDHPAVVIAHDITKPVALTDSLFIKGSSSMKPSNILRWLLRGTGPLTSPGCDHGAFVKTKAGLDDADLQLRFVAGRATDADGVRSYIEIGSGGQIVGVRAKSRGKISLRSSNPFDPPKIETRYLSDAEDMETLKNGIRLARKIVSQDAFKDVLGPEIFPGQNVQTDDQLEAYIKDSLHTANALVGTCRIGQPSDPLAVVDPDLKVIGVKGLRVVDASVMPVIPGGQTGHPTVALAERAAEVIRAQTGDFIEAGVRRGGVRGFFDKVFGRKAVA